MNRFEDEFAEKMGRRFARLVGRGTTALYVALRAIALHDGPGEIILPDVICSTVLDAVLLAGFRPCFADVTADRLTIDLADVRRKLNPTTRGVIIAHTFGNVLDTPSSNLIDTLSINGHHVRIIEDAVQGLGGTRVGRLGDISFTSFHPTKMIAGFGGLVATDDADLWTAIARVPLDGKTADESGSVERIAPLFHRLRGEKGLGDRGGMQFAPFAEGRYGYYRRQLAATRDMLIRPFDDSQDNIALIHDGWEKLTDNVDRRNEKAAVIRLALASSTELMLPEIRQGDALWRYTFAASTRASAAWIARRLQLAGLRGSQLYPSLSAIFAPDPALRSAELAPRLVNLWVDDSTDPAEITRDLDVIRAAVAQRTNETMPGRLTKP